MKKFLTIVMVALMVISISSCGKFEEKNEASKMVNKSVEDIFIEEMKEKNISNLHFFNTSELNSEILKNRKGNGIIVERIIGIVENSETGDGKIINTNNCYNYINYNSVDFEIENEMIIVTYLVYNPATDYTDDVIEIYDYPITGVSEENL